MKTRLILAGIALLCLSGRQRTSKLSVAIQSECAVEVLDTSIQRFDSGLGSTYSGVTRFRLRARTSRTGKGEILLRLPPGSGSGVLNFAFAARMGSTGPAFTGTTKDPTTALVVATIGPNSHTDKLGVIGSIEWTCLTDAAARASFSPSPQLTAVCQ
jgi:hypothetical protein